MKQVTLLGDSIRLGYQKTVEEILKDRARVWGPEGNCMHSIHHTFNLAWYGERPADVIHFNFGLWDCRRLGRNRPENAVPLELFVRNLDYVLERVRESTQATLIWATITPVVQDRFDATHDKPFVPSRKAEDVALYNAAAAAVLDRYGIIVNDLYSFVEEQGREQMICEDGVHYTEEGCRLLGRRVAEVIQKHL